MVSAIGIRVYLISLRNKGDRHKSIPFDTKDAKTSAPKFISEFILSHSTATQNDERERSWYFEEKITEGHGNSKGYVHYGTFGFESNFVDSKTKKHNYRRKITDVEEIPLFYEFWCPPKSNRAFVAFQSFQGRSCIQMVMDEIKNLFEAKNPGLVISFKKLLPGALKGSAFSGAPVKKLRFIRRNFPADLAERYLPARPIKDVDFEISISAKRKGTLGSFSDFATSINKSLTGVFLHDGVSFNEAVAEVRVGGRTRRVGVFGINSDAGVIDVSDDVVKGPDGHPTFESMMKESDALLKDFHTTTSAVQL